ncbi:hypothetical protein K493DRAFT_315677 [Basidiobolus meristosporus CBS 931.73]|uniref:Beta-Casp domain-containing protein n=1 Tax=Basidiobolus meristosporus CBS 931.73 TaxID=1314790 RepID=A0A1Y1Y7Q5_9FUNG|nr:hypothetical protein K493DRAFT_315677 [Basidiobolus meristosporus CBS 931.73]|eukprot:ORX94047.1 hypothetical protein K493DRAFT_315677 [Basidiobolus meristosporus CBS 931.73]
MIKDCMKKVIALNLHETAYVDDELEIKPYYAGHVLGAAMFYVRVGEQSVVYTGDYNMTPDRHLGSAWIDKCRPDILITETTYATTIRDSKRSRERDFLQKVHDCVSQGGNVIIPVFALGRAQELCILIETYWERMGLNVPVYFSAGLTERANEYYKLFINWTNQKIKSTFTQRNMFDFKHIKPWERSYMDQPGPMVLFATPGMLHIGTSLEVFKKWAPFEKNMVILPGYCVAGTVGAKVLAGQKVIEVDNFTTIHVNLQVKNLSFSAHADAKGIMQLIRQCEPRNVILVHGEKSKMGFLQTKITKEFDISCYYPANGTSLTIETNNVATVDISVELMKKHLEMSRTLTTDLFNSSNPVERQSAISQLRPKQKVPIQGVLVYNKGKPDRLISRDEFVNNAQEHSHQLFFELTKVFDPSKLYTASDMDVTQDPSLRALDKVKEALVAALGNTLQVETTPELHVKIRTIEIRPTADARTDALLVTWSFADEDLANRVLSIMNFTLLP